MALRADEWKESRYECCLSSIIVSIGDAPVGQCILVACVVAGGAWCTAKETLHTWMKLGIKTSAKEVPAHFTGLSSHSFTFWNEHHPMNISFNNAAITPSCVSTCPTNMEILEIVNGSLTLAPQVRHAADIDHHLAPLPWYVGTHIP